MQQNYLIDQKSVGRDDFLCELVNQFIARRKELGYSQEQVDAIMGNADRLCSKWECGMRAPTSFNLFCWAEALGGELQLINETSPRVEHTPQRSFCDFGKRSHETNKSEIYQL